MLSKLDLIFLQGWNRQAVDTGIKTIGQNNSVSLIDQRFTGVMDSFYFYSSDNQVEVSIIIDQAEKKAVVQDMYLAGYLYPNSTMPYVGTYQPTNGTAGNYVVLWNPSEVEPVNEHIAVSARLNNTSTQTSAVIKAQVLYYSIADKSLFMDSLRTYAQYLYGRSTTQPPATQPPATQQNPFLLYVP